MLNLTMIIRGCTRGDARYQKVLYEEYYSPLMKVTFRYASTYEQALVLTQNGFIKIFREFIRPGIVQYVTTKETLFAWVKKTFIIAIIDHIKSEVDLHMLRPIPDDVWKECDRPFTEIEIMNIELIKILKGLPTPYRLTFNLHVIDGFTRRETAGMLGITLEGTKQNLIRAREYLNKSIPAPF